MALFFRLGVTIPYTWNVPVWAKKRPHGHIIGSWGRKVAIKTYNYLQQRLQR